MKSSFSKLGNLSTSLNLLELEPFFHLIIFLFIRNLIRICLLQLKFSVIVNWHCSERWEANKRNNKWKLFFFPGDFRLRSHWSCAEAALIAPDTSRQNEATWGYLPPPVPPPLYLSGKNTLTHSHTYTLETEFRYLCESGISVWVWVYMSAWIHMWIHDVSDHTFASTLGPRRLLTRSRWPCSLELLGPSAEIL